MNENTQISETLRENQSLFDTLLSTDQNFDLLFRTARIAGHEAGYYFIDGFIKDEIMEKLLEFFYSLTPEDLPDDSSGLSMDALPYVEVDLLADIEQIQNAVLSGIVCLFIDGFSKCFAIDCRTYPSRSVEEPEKDKVLRGSRDGFVETLISNTALIRRRIRSPRLTMEMHQVGESSHTDIVLCYMEGRADPKLLETVRERLQTVKVDALTMNQESIAECIYRGKWYNPFPKFKYTERPDAAAAGILEGKLAILTDNSPAALMLPETLFDILEEADDFYFPPVTGTYLRLSRFLIGTLALFLTPVWLLLMQNPQWIPEWLAFIQIRETVYVPLILQLLALEFAIDGLKLAAINTPSMLTTPLSVIAALVIGDFAAQSGWFNSETMLYMAFVTIANYMQASYELSYAFKFMRMILLILTWGFNLWGFLAGVILIGVLMLTNKTISGESYLYPLIPFDGRQLARRLFRKRIACDYPKKAE
ncbi:MAG: spore germination protein [Eubacteriales bacterium]|nr:spore germination protein [Eubacteriales bacterium]